MNGIMSSPAQVDAFLDLTRESVGLGSIISTVSRCSNQDHNTHNSNSYFAPVIEYIGSVPSTVTAQTSPLELDHSHPGQEVQWHEWELSKALAKGLITSGLGQIYNSLEHAVPCGSMEQNCPCEMRNLTKSGVLSFVSLPAVFSARSLYRRVYQFDAALSSLRPKSFTVAEHAGVSKALKLAVMAFGRQ